MTESHINKLVLAGFENVTIHPDHLRKEQQTALNDLLKESVFQPVNDNTGPYDVTLAFEENRLVIYVTNSQGKALNTMVLSLSPYRRLIQDYFLMIESYETARHEGNREKLEAIDMGRRGVHNEGAKLFMTRLKDKIAMDFATARKLFTLVCVLNKNEVLLTR